MGRWSEKIAVDFIQQLAQPPSSRWVDVGCGTGALLRQIWALTEPAAVAGVEPSAGFIETARHLSPAETTFRVAGGDDTGLDANSADIVVSGLALNFMPDPVAAVREWSRVVVRGGRVAVYVWDYAEGMEFLKVFWDVAAELDGSAAKFDEGARFPICAPEPLEETFQAAGLSHVASGHIEIETRFAGFDDYWIPFTRGQGPAPSYVAELDESAVGSLRTELERRVPRDGNDVVFRARAWTVQGTASR